MRISFYAPLKAPVDPVPSGDRRMARQLVTALRHAGHDVSWAHVFSHAVYIFDFFTLESTGIRVDDTVVSQM